jgi:Mn-containing catalase
MAESTGRVLATRLYEMTDDPGMKDMLSFLIARDTMHQNQWLAVLADLGGVQQVHPIPNSFPQSQENGQFNYAFVSTQKDAPTDPVQRWTTGPSIDGRGTFAFVPAEPLGGEPKLAPPVPESHGQSEQMRGARASDENIDRPLSR